jgi:catechol 2,3-dioxygenase
VEIGHVHLSVADLDRSTDFYRDGIGLEVTADARPVGIPVVFLAHGDYHHHIGLNAFESAGAEPAPDGHPGLYHVAFVYPDREALVGAVERLEAHNYEVDRGRDHGATVSVYLYDPDRNGVELYYDRPREHWYDDAGNPVLRNDPIDPHALP